MNSTERLMSYFCPFGSLDIGTACDIGDKVGLHEWQVFEVIDEFRESI